MKIAFLNIYQGAVERGLETYISELTKRLEKNHQVNIYAGSSGPVKRWPLLWRLYLDPHGAKIALFTLKLIPQIWREKYDVVVPLNGGWQPALIRIVTWLYGGKMIISGQSGKGWDDRNNLWCFPDSFIALSSNALGWAKKANPFVRVDKIPNGVDVSLFKPNGPKYKINLSRPIVICQGAAEPSKRLHLAIKAVAILKSVSLLVVGTGSLEKDIRSLGQKLLGKRFGMLHVNHELMPSIYRSGDAFTLPSETSEAFGISIIEAMATNLPVVVNNDEIRKEIVGKAGMLTDPDDTAVYAGALEKALKENWDNKPRIQAEKYSWDEISKKYEELFSTLVKEK